MKIPKISGYTVAKVVGLAVYAVGTAFYGVLNYMEGEEAEWNYIADKADESGSMYLHDGDINSRDNMYWIAGREFSKKIWEAAKLKKEDEHKDE